MDKHEPESGLSFERVVFFSDAVFAIVITLLVLELKVPHLEEHTDPALRRALFNLLPRVAGFVISFLIVGLMWIEHHRIFRYRELQCWTALAQPAAAVVYFLCSISNCAVQ
jgi:uncharacterized membrane protein